jgi:tetratricopeptide (TPR) repeat protein
MRMRLCDLLVREDKISEALEAYRKTLTAQQELIERTPARLDLQEDLCRLHSLVGNLLGRQGDSVGAITSFEAGLRAAKPLPWQSIGNPEFQFSLASLHQALAYALYDRDQSNPDNIERALAAYARARTVLQNLIDSYPNYPSYRRELALLSSRIGGLLHFQDKTEDALRACDDSVTNLRQLSVQDDGNLTYKRDLALALHKLGDVRLKANPAGTIEACRECRTIRAALHERDPHDAGLAFELSSTHDTMAKALAANDDFEAATATLRQGLEIAEHALKAAGSNPVRRAHIAFLHSSLAAIQKQAKDFTQAEAEYRCALKINKAIAEEYPENSRWIREVLYSYERLAELLEPVKARIQLTHALEQSHELNEIERSAKATKEMTRIQQKLDALAAPKA